MTMPAKFSAEQKKLALLVLLVVVAGVIYFRPSSSEEPPESSKAPRPARASLKQLFQNPQTVEVSTTPSGTLPSLAAGKAAARDFKPSMKRKPGSAPDPENFDPTLRVDLLKKVGTVSVQHVERSLFDFYTPPVVIAQPVIMIGPEPPPPPPAPVVPPPPPPIPLRFFGNTLLAHGGAKKVFCVLNDQVMIPSEGEIVQRRYKIQRILQASVLVEDLQYHHEQTLPIDKPPEVR